MDNTISANRFEDCMPTNTGWRGAHNASAGRGRGYPRGGRMPQVYRNRSLVLNGGVASLPPEITSANSSNEISASPPAITSSSPAWVTKTDRHLQLINPAIYEKQSLQRAKAIEETRKLKLKQRDERERLRFNKHLQRTVDSSELTSPSNYELAVQGIRFRVVKNGSKLLRVSGKGRGLVRCSGFISNINSMVPTYECFRWRERGKVNPKDCYNRRCYVL